MGFLYLALSALGFLMGAIGGLGAELLDSFAGKRLEALCRLRQNRDRFGEIIDSIDDVIAASEYLRMIGTVTFLVSGTATLILYSPDFTPVQLIGWGLLAVVAMMLTHSWLPAAVTRFAPPTLLYHSWPFWQILKFVMAPLSVPGVAMEGISRRIAGVKKKVNEEEDLLEDEIRTMLLTGEREGYFGPEIKEMITSVMDLHAENVRHIMTARGRVDAIPIDAPWSLVLQVAIESGRTRLPVFDGDLGTVRGVLYVKDLLPRLADNTLEDASLAELLRAPWSVPQDRSVEQLLREFRHKRSHLAIVVDEFQQTAGVVTIEDALEQIVGEIHDESDVELPPMIAMIDPHTCKTAGGTKMDDLNEQLGWDVPEHDDYETVAGFILHHTGQIPREGDQLTIEGFNVKILKAGSRTIDSVELTRS